MKQQESVFFTRHSVFDVKGNTIAYDLRCHPDGAFAAGSSCLNHLDTIQKTLGQTHVILKADESLLFSDFLTDALSGTLILSLSSDIVLTDSIQNRILELSDKGFRFALDNVCTNSSHLAELSVLFPFISYVKIDITQCENEHILNTLSRMKPYSFLFLAKQIDSHEQFSLVQSFGFSLYEGTFYNNVSVIDGARVKPLTLQIFRLMAILQREHSPLEVQKEFDTSPDLLLNLLRYINSASFSFQNGIKHIRHALALLGPKRLLSWLALFLYSDKEEKSFGTALIKTALFRAKMMEELCLLIGQPQERESAFFVGALSIIDTYFNMEPEALLSTMPLDPDIHDALLSYEGFLGELLSVTKSFEGGNDTLIMPGGTLPYGLKADVLCTVLADAYIFSDQMYELL